MSKFVSFPSGDPRKLLSANKAKVLDAAIGAVTEASQTTASLAKQNLTNLGRVDTGNLRGSISYKVEVNKFVVTGIAICGAAYGQWVEFGRLGAVKSYQGIDRKNAAKAAWPPIDALVAWVRRKRREFAPSGRTASGRARPAADRDVRSLAFVVARKIYRFGIKPSPFMGPAFARVKPTFYRRFAERLRSAR